MKKIIGLFICIIVMLAGCSSESKDVKKDVKKDEEQVQKEKELNAKVVEYLKKSRQLAEEDKLGEAIDAVDEAIKLGGETRGNLGLKHGLLMKLEKYEEALKVALRRDEITERKSPWNSMPIVETYLKLGNIEKALEYLSITVNERRFIYLDYLESETFALLHDNPEFQKLLEKIKEFIGIGKPAKDFTLPVLGGGEYTLSAQKGKVILVDFWATWCPPCREELPFMMELYAKYKDKNFGIIGISLDDKEETLKNFINEKGMGWDIAYSGKAWYDETVKLYNVSSIPSTFLIDKNGILRYFNVHDKKLGEAVKTLLEEE